MQNWALLLLSRNAASAKSNFGSILYTVFFRFWIGVHGDEKQVILEQACSWPLRRQYFAAFWGSSVSGTIKTDVSPGLCFQVQLTAVIPSVSALQDNAMQTSKVCTMQALCARQTTLCALCCSRQSYKGRNALCSVHNVWGHLGLLLLIVHQIFDMSLKVNTRTEQLYIVQLLKNKYHQRWKNGDFARFFWEMNPFYTVSSLAPVIQTCQMGNPARSRQHMTSGRKCGNE